MNRDFTVFRKIVLGRFLAVPQDMRNFFKLKRY